MTETTWPQVRAEGPVLVFGGPCSNLQATQAVLAEARRRGIPPDHVICTGDLAAYCGEPAATIDLVRDNGIHVVMGNCDEQLGLSRDDCACGFAPGSDCEKLSAAWFAHADAQVGEQARAWLARRLSQRIDLHIGSLRLAIVHGSVTSMNRFVFASTAAALKAADLDLLGHDIDGVIGGHCGLPFTEIIDGRLWHNAGIVGIPANDGTPRAWCSVLSPAAHGIEIEHVALTYDHAAAADAMARARLPAEYREALSSGLWPSCDALPAREIRERGIALEPGTVQFARTARPNRRRTPRPRVAEATQLWPAPTRGLHPLPSAKFKDPVLTATGEKRASVPPRQLETLWFNTGTLCNITCRGCYIESSPRNDRLAYLALDDVLLYLDEIERTRLGTTEIGFTGGEPFMNPHLVDMLDACLDRGLRVLVLTNAMKPMLRHRARLLALGKRAGSALTIRVSLDHFTAARHEEERGPGTFAVTLNGLRWLARNDFQVAVAGRTMWGEPEASERAGYARLFAEQGIPIDAADPAALVLFPEMDAAADVPEITTACWGILGKSPADMMCANSRMVVKRKGASRTSVVACTLLPYDPAFELGATLAEARRQVPLNHPHCARFCVLGGASCAPANATHEAETLRPASDAHANA